MVSTTLIDIPNIDTRIPDTAIPISVSCLKDSITMDITIIAKPIIKIVIDIFPSLVNSFDFLSSITNTLNYI